MGLWAKLKGKTRTQVPPLHRAQPTSRYRGVQVVTDNQSCCRAARKISSQRFLSNEVPRLPLDDCNTKDCQCTYRLFDDRRTGTRRLSDFGRDIGSELRSDKDRRSAINDRRSEPVDEEAILARIASTLR